MRASNILICALVLQAAAVAQVLSPEEIRDPEIGALQRKYFAELKLITKAAAAHSFPYHFYFSRTLDIPEKEEPGSDQRAVQFDRYQDQTVLKITGNYFASYSVELMKPEERARQTYEDVMFPLLEASVQALENADVPQAFAFEISHHVRKKVLGVSSEGVENVVLILPRDSARRLVAAADPAARQAAILEGKAFLNAVPISFWPRPEEDVAQAEQTAHTATKAPRVLAASPHPAKDAAIPNRPAQPPAAILSPAPVPPLAETAPSRDTSPDAVKKLQSSYQPDLDRMVQELNSQAHFVGYAPPAFVPFHKGLYLQLSVTTTLPKTAAGSQYRLSALAFDQHMAHLIRPVLEYLKGHEDFDGVDFSTTVRLAGEQSSDGGTVAVEFIFPLSLLHSYAQFDCTGQQLIDASFILINGERVSLNLQMAEAGS